MFDFFSFFNRIFGGPLEDTRSAARDRLRLVRQRPGHRGTSTDGISAQRVDRGDLRHMEIDTCSMQMGLERHEGS